LKDYLIYLNFSKRQDRIGKDEIRGSITWDEKYCEEVEDTRPSLKCRPETPSLSNIDNNHRSISTKM